MKSFLINYDMSAFEVYPEALVAAIYSIGSEDDTHMFNSLEVIEESLLSNGISDEQTNGIIDSLLEQFKENEFLLKLLYNSHLKRTIYEEDGYICGVKSMGRDTVVFIGTWDEDSVI